MIPPSLHQPHHEVRLASRDREHDRLARPSGSEGIANLRCCGSRDTSSKSDDIPLLQPRGAGR